MVAHAAGASMLPCMSAHAAADKDEIMNLLHPMAATLSDIQITDLGAST